MKVAIIGSRTYTDYVKMKKLLDSILVGLSAVGSPMCILTGGAVGADSLAMQWCKENNIECEVFLPDYKKVKPPQFAPLKRNEQIVQNADKVIAFWDGYSKGTLDAIQKAVQNNKRVTIIPFKGDNNE